MIDAALSAVSRAFIAITRTSGLTAASMAARALDLGPADALGRMNDLALQVGEIHDIVIDDAERADSGRRQVEQQRRAEAAGADHEHAR